MNKLTYFSVIFLLFALLSSCKEDPAEIIIDSSLPQGAFTASQTGTFVAESGAPTAGTATVTASVDATKAAAEVVNETIGGTAC